MTEAQAEFQERLRGYNWQRATFISDPYDTKSRMNDTTIFDEYRKVSINLVMPKII
jgi:hypothetical protein